MTFTPGDIPLPAPPDREPASTCPPPHKPSAARQPEGRAAVAEATVATAASAGTVKPRHRATGPLSPDERQQLARLARAAWIRCGAEGAGQDFNEWRHDQVALATDGKAQGIKAVIRSQYRDVESHFATIAGESVRAFRAAKRAGQNPADRDLALAKLKEACAGGGLSYPEYPESICRRQFKCDLDDLETGKVWFLFYTCTTRARAKNKNATEIASEGLSGESAPGRLENDSEAGNPTGGLGES